MKTTFAARAPVTAIVWLTLSIASALAQGQPNAIRVVYEPPKKADYRPIYERLQQRKVLETLQQFLVPLKLPRQLTVRTAECGGDPFAPYNPGGPVTICYEFVDFVERLQLPDRIGVVGGSLVTQQMTLVGPFVQEALHDVALGAFDLLDVPVWGRVEDAADHVAAFLMLQFGPDVARKTFLGTAYFLNELDIAIRNNTNLLADINYLGAVRPTVRQRYYNILCVAVGADPVGFSALLPVNRAATAADVPLDRGCISGDEYKQVKYAFVSTILTPYIDPDLLKQVRGMQWLKD